MCNASPTILKNINFELYFKTVERAVNGRKMAIAG
jgi:hypothetical protein